MEVPHNISSDGVARWHANSELRAAALHPDVPFMTRRCLKKLCCRVCSGLMDLEITSNSTLEAVTLGLLHARHTEQIRRNHVLSAIR